jgi:serine/threonine protein phosphatase 1
VPSQRHIIAIGDVHGCNRELNLLLGELPVRNDTTIIFLGDYVDRGPDSRGVVDTVLELSRRHNVIPLMGNHEELFMEFLSNPGSGRAGTFLFNGGGATLASYGSVDGRFDIPEEHLEFFKELLLFYETEDYFFVHAGVPLIPLDELDMSKHREVLLWMRDPFLRSDFSWSKVIVHGHTAVVDVELMPNRINLDTGCALGNMLTAMEFPSRTIYQVQKRRVEETAHLTDSSGRRRAIRFEGAIPVYIDRAGGVLELETLDHNEFGMLCRDLDPAPDVLLRIGESVRGCIGRDTPAAVEFSGTVVRCREEEAVYYAVAIDTFRPRTPLDR